jgi:hypothetical protein
VPGHYTVEATSEAGRRTSVAIDIERTSSVTDIVDLSLP